MGMAVHARGVRCSTVTKTIAKAMDNGSVATIITASATTIITTTITASATTTGNGLKRPHGLTMLATVHVIVD